MALAVELLSRASFREMKEVVITGGGGGLGQAVAHVFESPDWKVSAPGSFELDVRDRVAVARYFRDHSPDLLVCAAGMIRDMPLARVTESDWDEILAVNCQGAQACAVAAIAGMVARGGGHIVFISSFSALHPPSGQVAYATAKSALIGLTADLASRHGPSNIRINAVLPGFLETKMTGSVSVKRRSIVLSAHALGRFNTVDVTAKFIRYLHDQLPHTSGQVFQLDSRAGFNNLP